MAPTTLLTLLPELLHHLTSNLTYASHLSLSLTCKTLRARLEDPNQRLPIPRAPLSDADTAPPAKPYTMADLLEIELWPEHCIRYRIGHGPVNGDYYACKICLRLRSGPHLSENMMTGTLDKVWAGSVEERGERLCITCGIEKGLYPRGTMIEIGGVGGGRGFLCQGCGLLTRDTGQTWLEYGRLYCQTCWGPRGWGERIWERNTHARGGCLPENFYRS